MGVSVLVVGIRLGLQFSKSHDKHGNANREAEMKSVEFGYEWQSHVVPLFVPLLRFSRIVQAEARKVYFNQYTQRFISYLSKRKKRGKTAQNRILSLGFLPLSFPAMVSEKPVVPG